jgi:hypothetical protein
MTSVIQGSHPLENIWTQAVRLQDRTADSSMGTFGKIILNLWGRVAKLCTVCCNKTGFSKFIYVFHVNLILKWLFHYVVSTHWFYNGHRPCALWGTSWKFGYNLDESLSRASLFWDLWWTKHKWESIFSKSFDFTVSLSFHQCSILISFTLLLSEKMLIRFITKTLSPLDVTQ